MLLTYNFWLQSVFGMLVTLVGWTYLSWRVWQLYLVSPSNAIPYMFLILEIAMYISSVLWFVDMLWTRDQIRVPHVLPVDNFLQWPTVDIFIPCCKEPTELIKDTILTALWQDYPAEKFTVYVCDDGKDETLRDWIENEQAVNGTNIRYISRVKTVGQPHHAKAGNINHALTLTSSEFIAILDADMLVRPHFLRSMLAQFTSNDTAFVQCPQYYYNVPDGDPLGQVCAFFYDIIMPQRDTRNSAPSVGTGVVFRRKALEEVGGISTGTLTEDFDTSLKLHARGWKTVYINSKLQFGLIPTDLKSSLRQRERWAIGTLEILFKRNPLFTPGLSIHQRIMYFSCGLSYILPIFLLFFTLIPILTLFFDWPIMPVTAGNTQTLVYLLVPYLFCTRAVIYVMYWNIEDAMTARNRDFQMFLWMAPYLCVAIYKFMISGIKATSFKVTNAAGKASKFLSPEATDLLYCWYHICYLSIGVAALVYRGLKWNVNSCTNTFQFISQVFYVILNMQSMLPPVLYVLFPSKPVDRTSRLTYNIYKVPQIDMEKVKPGKGKFVWLLEVAPALWGLFYLCIFIGFSSGYTFGCGAYFSDNTPAISLSEWSKSTAYIPG